ncbi:hypothetical protein B0H17DRAFT_1062015 [Mycena rosella]|uniref:Uncharacterized protein n=1 Tax=Mycena rosella TaxID=1033263 RepID=A0AAD7DIG9_MYCRO|nr:hypothetical protein B0H17DRAFT_1062015 [Mycena rosella]
MLTAITLRTTTRRKDSASSAPAETLKSSGVPSGPSPVLAPGEASACPSDEGSTLTAVNHIKSPKTSPRTILERMTPDRARAFGIKLSSLPETAPKGCTMILCAVGQDEYCVQEGVRVAMTAEYFVRGMKREIFGEVYRLFGNIDTRTYISGGAGSATSRAAFFAGFIEKRLNAELKNFIKAWLPSSLKVPSVVSGKRIRDAMREAASATVWESFAVALVGRPFGPDWALDRTALSQTMSRAKTGKAKKNDDSKLHQTVVNVLRAAQKFEEERKAASAEDFDRQLQRMGYERLIQNLITRVKVLIGVAVAAVVRRMNTLETAVG